MAIFLYRNSNVSCGVAANPKSLKTAMNGSFRDLEKVSQEGLT
jgi:hypothetical protein